MTPSKYAAKNVILAGVRSVTLHDTRAVERRDLGSQFYLTEEDFGKNRAEACRDRLQELNTAVAVVASTADLTEDFLRQFQVGAGWPKSKTHQLLYPSRCQTGLLSWTQVVVLTSSSLAEAKRIDEFCHKQVRMGLHAHGNPQAQRASPITSVD